ncbi:hypothetical protein H8356DRAFT_1432263 [Neocallimastix lanati (nom. inval.)]|nr:hypothetical protein H8356DRAFT_1432263 [Neocallimastix sp. JGI-2020a]
MKASSSSKVPAIIAVSLETLNLLEGKNGFYDKWCGAFRQIAIRQQHGEKQHFNTTPHSEMQPGEMQFGEMQLSQKFKLKKKTITIQIMKISGLN